MAEPGTVTKCDSDVGGEKRETYRNTDNRKQKRLTLRRFTIEDAENMYYNWASDPEVTKYSDLAAP